MRTWELEDNRAMPTDLVREQDFIMRVRRLHRHGGNYLIANLVLNASTGEVGGRGALHSALERLTAWGAAHNIEIAEMSNGDLFLLQIKNTVSAHWPREAVAVAWPDGLPSDLLPEALMLFDLPEAYEALRERLNSYVEISRQIAALQDGSSPANLLLSEAARGPLTAWSVNQIGRLLTDIDISRFVRRQPICTRDNEGQWQALIDECFISFSDLRQEHFPKLDEALPEHLFMALCHDLDQHLLQQISDGKLHYHERLISLNLSVASIASPFFTRFAHTIPPHLRKQIGFELHRGDLLMDFATTMNAIETLRQEGFHIVVDGITPDFLPYLNLELFGFDFIKLNVAKDRAQLLQKPETQRAIAKLPRDQLIFFRCDSEMALQIGLALGISKFQGWLIDEQLQRS